MSGAFFVGDWRIDPSLHSLSGLSGEVHLEPKLMQVLVLLAEHAGEVVSKERLLHVVWTDTFVGDEVLSRAISELRRAFKDDAKAPQYIQTIPKGGYRLIAPVRYAAGPPTAIALEDPEASLPVARSTPWWVRRWWVIPTAAAAASVMWVVTLQPHRSRATGRHVAPLKTVSFTTYPGIEGSPTFSPDGTRIAFHAKPDSPDLRIFVKLVGDDPPQQLTHGPGNDAFPAWSPDGRTIAFVRSSSDHDDIFIVSALGGRERQLVAVPAPYECSVRPRWSPDGRTIVYSMGASGPKRCHLAAFSLDTLESRPLTRPREHESDDSPAFSPDGQTVAFIRDHDMASDVYLMPAGGGAMKRLTFDEARKWGALAWTSDGNQLVFSSERDGAPALWRVSTGTGRYERLPLSGSNDPAIDVAGSRLAYVKVSDGDNPDLYVLDLSHPSRPLKTLASSTAEDSGPQYSPDGSKLAFQSGRSGDAFDIWVADANGSHPVRLTVLGLSVGPQWSPDGKWITFCSTAKGAWDVFVVQAAGGAARRLTFESSNDFAPVWSRDGRWIYFASDRTGSGEIWKIRAEGGTATQVTTGGGFYGFESADGKYLYYTKGPRQNGVWRKPLAGGDAEPVLVDMPRAVDGGTWNWVLVDDGIYFLDTTDVLRPAVEFFAFATRRTTRVASLTQAAGCGGPGMAISPDGRRLIVTLVNRSESDIMLVQNFH
jgi:Tol biopolymer transport system component/DNA-binding winged helix-turn-helix (wHTH) protein